MRSIKVVTKKDLPCFAYSTISWSFNSLDENYKFGTYKVNSPIIVIKETNGFIYFYSYIDHVEYNNSIETMEKYFILINNSKLAKLLFL